MKQNVLLAFVVGVVCLLTVSSKGYAQALDFSETKWEVGGQIGAAIPKEDDGETSFFLLGRVTYDLTPNIAIGGSAGWYGYEVQVESDDWGDATSVPLLANVIFKMPLDATDNRVVPYILGGIGVMFWSMDESNLLTNAGVSVDSEASFAGQIGAGVDYFIDERWAVFGEVSYIFSEVDTTISAPGLTGTLEGDTDVIMIGAGAKMRF